MHVAASVQWDQFSSRSRGPIRNDSRPAHPFSCDLTNRPVFHRPAILRKTRGWDLERPNESLSTRFVSFGDLRFLDSCALGFVFARYLGGAASDMYSCGNEATRGRGHRAQGIIRQRRTWRLLTTSPGCALGLPFRFADDALRRDLHIITPFAPRIGRTWRV